MSKRVNPAAPPPGAGAPAFPRRAQRARETRARILDSARAQFIERGYVGTTIQAIAERADVSPESVYAKFGNKASVLSSLVDVSIAGGAQQRPILEQEWVREVREEPDVSRRVHMLAAQGRSILERRAAIDEVVREAAPADPEIAELRVRSATQRYAGQRELLRIVSGPDGLRSGLDLDSAADVLYSIGSPETFRLLTVDRGWSGSRFERWYAESIRLLLLPPRGARE